MKIEKKITTEVAMKYPLSLLAWNSSTETEYRLASKKDTIASIVANISLHKVPSES